MTSPKPAERRLRLAPGSQITPPRCQKSWRLLIVDDEPEVHNVTRLALDGLHCHGRDIEFISAYSAAEALKVFRDTPDIALILLDVVMETEHAGLDLVRSIREDLGNPFVRIVLRTGQPGQAPEHKVITEYDINDYKHKTELTRQKLFTTVYTGISSYRDLIALDANRRGLEKVIEASASIFDLRSLSRFADGVLNQLTALLFLDQDAVMVRASGLMAQANGDDYEIVAASGRYSQVRGPLNSSQVDPSASARIAQARERKQSLFGENFYVGHHHDEAGVEHYLYVSGELPITVPDRHLIDLFTQNVAIAYSNVRLLKQASHAEEQQ